MADQQNMTKRLQSNSPMYNLRNNHKKYPKILRKHRNTTMEHYNSNNGRYLCHKGLRQVYHPLNIDLLTPTMARKK